MRLPVNREEAEEEIGLLEPHMFTLGLVGIPVINKIMSSIVSNELIKPRASTCLSVEFSQIVPVSKSMTSIIYFLASPTLEKIIQ